VRRQKLRREMTPSGLERREIKRAAERDGSARLEKRSGAIKEEGLSLDISMRDLKGGREFARVCPLERQSDREEPFFPSKRRNANDISIFEARDIAARESSLAGSFVISRSSPIIRENAKHGSGHPA